MADVLSHQQSFDYALSRTVSTLIDWFPAGPLSNSHSAVAVAATQHHHHDSHPIGAPTLEQPPPARRHSDLPLAPKTGIVTPRGGNTPAASGGASPLAPLSRGTPPVSGSFCGDSNASFVEGVSPTAPSPGKPWGGSTSAGFPPPAPPARGGSWWPFIGKSKDEGASSFSRPTPSWMPPLHLHSLVSSVATATLYESAPTLGVLERGGEVINTTTSGGYVVRAGMFTGLRLYASDSGGALKLFTTLRNKVLGKAGGPASVSPLDIGTAPIIQLRASVRSKDSVNAAGVRVTLQENGFSSLDFLLTAGRRRKPTQALPSSSGSGARRTPFYTHLCRFDKFLITNYGMFNLYEASQPVFGTNSAAPILRRLRAGFGVVVRTEKNGLNILWGFCAEVFKSLIVAFHADVIRRWCISCCSTNTLGVKGLEVGVRLRINLISYQNTALDFGLKQCVPLVVPSNCRTQQKKSFGAVASGHNNYDLGSWSWRLAGNSYGVAAGGSLDDADVADLIRAAADVVAGGDAGKSTLSCLGTSLARPIPTSFKRAFTTTTEPICNRLKLSEDGKARRVVDGLLHTVEAGYYVGVAVPLYCTAVTSSLSVTGAVALCDQLRCKFGAAPERKVAEAPTTAQLGGDKEDLSLWSKLAQKPLSFSEVRFAVGTAVRDSNWVSALQGSRVEVSCGVTTRLSLPSIMEYVGFTAPDLSNGLVNYFNNYGVANGEVEGTSSPSSPPLNVRAPSKPPLTPRAGSGNPSAASHRPAIKGLNCFVSITFS